MSSEEAKDQEPIPYHALLDENRALKEEMQRLKSRLEDAEELKRAISEGDMDALVIHRPEGELIFTLDSADRAYRVLVETMNEGTATLACDGTILYCNRHFAELLRMPPQAIVGTPVYRFIAYENVMTFKALLEHEISKGEINFLAEDGTSLPVYLSISSLQAEGSPNAWCLVVTDLTEQKKNEEILASELLARSIIEQAAEAIIVCDMSGRIIRFSNTTSQICGCDPTLQRFEYLMDLRFSEGPDAGKSILPVSSALKGFTILGMEATFEFNDYQKFHLLLNSGPLKNDHGEIIGCVVTLTDITESKRAEEALRESEERYRIFFENSIDAVLLTSPNGTVHAANSEACRIFGMTEEEIIQAERDGVVDTSDPRLQIALEERVRTGKFKGELNYRRKDGTIFPGEVSTSIFTDRNGLVKTSMIIRDITERKQAEKALKKAKANLEEKVKERTAELEEAYWSLLENERRLNEAQKMAHIGNWDWNPKTNEAYWSDETYRIFGLDPQEFRLPYDKVLNHVHPEDRDEADNAFKAALKGEPYHIDYRIISANGEERIVHAQGEVVFNEGNTQTPIRMRGTLQDITERKRSEDKIKRSEEKYRNIVETANEGILVIDKEAKVTFANKRMADMLGYTLEEGIGRPIWDFISKEFKAIAKQNVKKRQQGVNENYELKLMCKDGSPLWALISAKSLLDKNDKFAGSLSMLTDITERKTAEETLKLKLEELARSNAELEQFAYVSSHDLQEPLRMISSYLQLLQKRYQGKLDDKADKYIYFAVDGASRMQGLINDLLEFSRVASRAREPEFMDCEFLLDQVLSNLDLYIKENKASVSHDPLPEVMADNSQLIQVFQNLIINGIKFHSEEPPKIHVSAEKKANEWVFSAQDNGIGIDPQYSEKIFEVFKRLHKKEEYPGTGIGLSICKKIVERHYGRIWVESEPGKGSTFYFTLPINPGETSKTNF